MRFVAPMPGYLGRGGPHVQTLELIGSQGQQGLDLLFHYQLLQTLKTDWHENRPSEPVLLLSNIKQASFSYLGMDVQGEAGEWKDHWENTSEIPFLIRIEMDLDTVKRFPWPALVVKPMVDQTRRKHFGGI